MSNSFCRNVAMQTFSTGHDKATCVLKALLYYTILEFLEQLIIHCLPSVDHYILFSSYKYVVVATIYYQHERFSGLFYADCIYLRHSDFICIRIVFIYLGCTQQV